MCWEEGAKRWREERRFTLLPTKPPNLKLTAIWMDLPSEVDSLGSLARSGCPQPQEALRTIINPASLAHDILAICEHLAPRSKPGT